MLGLFYAHRLVADGIGLALSTQALCPFITPSVHV